jgi:hypothetical protein
MTVRSFLPEKPLNRARAIVRSAGFLVNNHA